MAKSTDKKNPVSGATKSGVSSKKASPSASQKQPENFSLETTSFFKFSPKDASHFWWLVFCMVVLAGFGTRLYKIEEPDHVCWDETHFGKMGSWYINHSFFFDVHPPLGKMLIGFSGLLTGYNGTFAFNKPGDKYGDHKYVGMRLFCACLGAAIVPFCYLIVWELTNSLQASVLSAVLVCLDIGMLTLSQYILLDPILMFFIIGSVLGMVKFQSQREKPFSLSWWFWLAFTGVFISCSISVKFVGLFVVLLVGFHTIADLWNLLGDLSLPIMTIFKHFSARFICLILLPSILYMSYFYVHLKILYKSGSGDGFFSSAFQSQLHGNSLFNATMPQDVAYGAVITLKNHRTGGGYLHSHWHLYPEGIGARQQQVTTYSHKDDNNRWIVKQFDKEADTINSTSEPKFVLNGDLIRLEHIVTSRNLHSHRVIAPVTKRHQQVSCYGENGTGDANDIWKIEIVGGSEKEVVRTVTTKLRLIHYLTGCALFSHSKQLPKWGYEQMEVTCNPNVRDKNNFWNVEDNIYPKLPNVSFEVYAPNFWEKFLESHAVMLQGNAGLKPKEGEITSRPWQWPLNYRGQFFSGNEYRIYLLGNPLIWWGNLVFLFFYFAVEGYLAFQRQRGNENDAQQEAYNKQMHNGCFWLFVGWFLHYVPFYVMGRVLYFHHYFPAAIFNSMISAVMISYVIDSLQRFVPKYLKDAVFHCLFGCVIGVLTYSFYLFHPLSYGMKGPPSTNTNSSMYGLKWMESWEF